MVGNFKVSYLKEIKNTRERIKYYRGLSGLALCQYKKAYFEELILQEIDYAIELIRQFSEYTFRNIEKEYYREDKIFTLEELSKYDGKEGRPAYAAVDGIVYDVSNSPAWGGASHFGITAGKDVSDEFKNCHGSADILSKIPRVGSLKV